MRVHPDLDQARLTAEAFRVLPSARGFYVWVFRPWTHRLGGWRVVVEVRAREDGWLHVLSRLGLMKDKPPTPLPRAPVTIRPAEEEWF